MRVKFFSLSLLFFCWYLEPSHAHQAIWKTSLPDTLEIDYAITKAFADKFSATLTANKVPFARRLDQLKNGEIDVLCGLLKNNDRERFAYFLRPPYKLRSNKYFFIRKGEGKRLQTYEDLYKLRVGVHIGSKYFPRFDEDEKLKKFVTPYYADSFKMLVSGRIDVVIHTDVYGLEIMNQLSLQDNVEVAPFMHTEKKPVYMAISRKSKLFNRKDELEDVFRLMVESGEIDRIIQSYFRSKGLPIPEYK
ncbi:ABC transporter substrate-binding protein [Desulfopila sp. IMCC35008]|uniref:substrate-binding periplasmic protein n=1 Tax=Desulfopila sp. IMCC35008 TaxID=2653858 RepID=UPI0013D0FF18|nr:transporter substrate-binding domain-containing protein [Desulfopila sp. IMCC35008]